MSLASIFPQQSNGEVHDPDTKPKLRKMFSASCLDAPSPTSEPVNVFLERQVTFGFSIAGSNKNPGVFIAHVDAHTPASRSRKLRPGQLILKLNGRDCSGLNKKQVGALLREANVLTLKAIYDPIGFAKYDNGHELRQETLHRLQDLLSEAENQEVIQSHVSVLSHMNPQTLEGFQRQAFLDEAPALLSACKHHIIKTPHTEASISDMCLRLQSKRGDVALDSIPLVDVVFVEPYNKSIVIVQQKLPEISPFGPSGQTFFLLHYWTCRNKKHARSFAEQCKKLLARTFSTLQKQLSCPSLDSAKGQ